jgi:hypothetical protein
MSFKAFLSEVEKGLPKPFYLFSAEDPFLQREALEALSESQSTQQTVRQPEYGEWISLQ